MNHVPARNRQAEEVARIEEIVRRHALPDFVTGFDVRLGEFDGDPMMWITFKTVGRWNPDAQARQNRINELHSLRWRVFPDLLDEFEHRYPLIRFEPANPEDPEQI